MSFFVTKADGAYSLTTAGYVAVAVILVALIVVAALLAKREKKEKKKMYVFVALLHLKIKLIKTRYSVILLT